MGKTLEARCQSGWGEILIHQKLRVGDLVEWKDPYTKTAPPRLGLIISELVCSDGQMMYALFRPWSCSEFEGPWGAWAEEITLVTGEER